MYDIGCYATSCARFLIGTEPIRALSLVRRDKNLAIDSLSSGILDFGGPRATFTVGTQSFPTQRVDVLGTAGSIALHLPFNAWPDTPVRVTVTTAVGVRNFEPPATDQYLLMVEAFSRAIREERPVPIPTADAVANMKVLGALFRSERSGAWETVH